MARAVRERELTGQDTRRVQFAVANETDDAEIRRLLRDNPTRGAISLSFQREPDFFRDVHLPGQTKQTIVARQGDRVVCAGSCVVRERFVNGESRRVGYLGGLRLDEMAAGRFDILRRGYEFFRELQVEAPADFYFTSIAADNQRARRLLEHGLPGMPRYEFLGEFVTVLVPVDGRTHLRAGWELQQDEREHLLGRVLADNCQRQLSPKWSSAELVSLENLGLQREDFFSLYRQNKIVASAAMWDQRIFKQTVVTNYSSLLSTLQPVINVVTGALGSPRLPKVGIPLANAFVSHLVVEGDEPEALVELIAALSGVAQQKKIGLLTLGFAMNDPRLASVRKSFRGREYRSCLYCVRWPQLGGGAGDLQTGVLAPEVALL